MSDLAVQVMIFGIFIVLAPLIAASLYHQGRRAERKHLARNVGDEVEHYLIVRIR